MTWAELYRLTSHRGLDTLALRARAAVLTSGRITLRRKMDDVKDNLRLLCFTLDAQHVPVTQEDESAVLGS